MKATPASIKHEGFVPFAEREWTDEDIRFVCGDIGKEIDETGRALALELMDLARREIDEVYSELGQPDGFDPYVAGLVYARASFARIVENDREIAERDLRIAQLELALLKLQKHVLGGDQ